MPGRLRMARGMAVGRAVAAADPPTCLTHPQMHPASADRQALLAARDRLGKVEHGDLVEMGARSQETITMAAK